VVIVRYGYFASNRYFVFVSYFNYITIFTAEMSSTNVNRNLLHEEGDINYYIYF
jgi:hypothetical protein